VLQDAWGAAALSARQQQQLCARASADPLHRLDVLRDCRQAAGAGRALERGVPFVTLHQPSGAYGVCSEPLGKFKGRREFLSPTDLATGSEVLEYYSRVMAKFVATGRVRFYPSVTYDFDTRSFTDAKGQVKTVCFTTLVTPESYVTVPSMRPPPFPVEEGAATIKPVNALPTEEASRYVVLGCGKTGTDAVLHLLRRGVDQRQISWVVPRDTWYLLREKIWSPASGSILPFKLAFTNALLRSDSILGAFKALERAGYLGRLTLDHEPVQCRGALIRTADLHLLRTVQDVVRLGRVTAVRPNRLELEKGTMPLEPGSLLVDCTACGTGGYTANYDVWSPGHIRLSSNLTLFNPSHSSALVAYIETTSTDAAAKNKFIAHSAASPLLVVDGSPNFHGHLSQLVQGVYSELKTMRAIQAHGKKSFNFYFAARTNYVAPCHVPLRKTLWVMFGPARLDKKATRLMRKIERVGFEDMPPVDPRPRKAAASPARMVA